jgi:hypothetical protein
MKRRARFNLLLLDESEVYFDVSCGRFGARLLQKLRYTGRSLLACLPVIATISGVHRHASGAV